MSVQLLRASEFRSMPWANGSGTTLEVLRWPEGDATAFEWRVSLADVSASAEFSLFAGIDRVIVPCDGPGLELVVDAETRVVAPLEVFGFAGGVADGVRRTGSADPRPERHDPPGPVSGRGRDPPGRPVAPAERRWGPESAVAVEATGLLAVIDLYELPGQR